MGNKNNSHCQSVIGPSMVIKGDVSTDAPVVIKGKLDGTFSGKQLTIVESGHVFGTVQGEEIICSGKMEGKIVTNSLILHESGCHVGTVETQELEVALGAVLDCALQSGIKKDKPQAVQQRVERKSVTTIDLGRVRHAFQDGERPCCMDVPWSERQELYKNFEQLLYKGKLLIKVIGENSSGKTTLVKKFQDGGIGEYTPVILNNQVGSVTDILRRIAHHFFLDDVQKDDQDGLLAALLAAVQAEKDSKFVLVIDDAEKMYPATLEGVVRLLTGSYGDEEPILPIIILGTQELDKSIVATIVEYFEDETNCQLFLEPLTIKETADYIRFCLQLAAPDDQTSVLVFPFETIKEIHLKSDGNIARINSIAHQGLQVAHQAEGSEVLLKYVR